MVRSSAVSLVCAGRSRFAAQIVVVSSLPPAAINHARYLCKRLHQRFPELAIAVGLRTSAAGAVAGFEETSVRALAKVIQLLPPRLRRRIDALRVVTAPGAFGGGPVLDPTVLTTIALACRGEERLRFDTGNDFELRCIVSDR